MRNELFSKGLVFVVMVLFVGITTASAISTIDSPTSIMKSPREATSASQFPTGSYDITSSGEGKGFYRGWFPPDTTPVIAFYKTGETVITPGLGLPRVYGGRHIVIALRFMGVISDPGDGTFGFDGKATIAFGIQL